MLHQLLPDSETFCFEMQGREKKQNKKQPNMHLSGLSLNSFLQILKKVTLSSFLADSLHPAHKTGLLALDFDLV